MPSRSFACPVDLLIYSILAKRGAVQAEMEVEVIEQCRPDLFTPEQLDANREADLAPIQFTGAVPEEEISVDDDDSEQSNDKYLARGGRVAFQPQ